MSFTKQHLLDSLRQNPMVLQSKTASSLQWKMSLILGQHALKYETLMIYADFLEKKKKEKKMPLC